MVEAQETFKYLKVIQSLQDASKSLSDIPIEPFCAALFEWTILFKMMGKALSMAFADITEKVAILRNHKQNYGSKISGLMSLIQLEISQNIHKLNGENNKDLTNNKEFYKYEAGTRTILRLMWFMDFLTFMMEGIIGDLKLSFGKCCKKAYKKALEPHHPLLVRTAAKAAWLIAPDRQKFYTMIMGNQAKTESECIEVCKNLIEAFKSVRVTLWKYYEDYSLKELP